MAIEIKVPDLGDGVESGDILEVFVSEGDTIEEGQDIVDLETDKSNTGVPSDHSGKIVKVHVSEGDVVKPGDTLITVESSDAAAPAAPAPQPEPAAEPEPTPAAESKPAPTPQLEPKAPAPQQAAAPQSTPQPAPEPAGSNAGGNIPAGPSMRRLARELGVDLSSVTGSGQGGRIVREDVVKVVRSGNGGAAKSAPVSADSDGYGPVRRERMPKIRKTIANQMVQSWTTAPRVTNFDDADVTDLEALRQANKADYMEKGIKLTTMPFIIKSVAMALRDHSELNAEVDMEAGEIIYKDYVNIGIAVDSERGLVVPVMKNADQMTIPDIARSLATMADGVRNNNFDLSDLRGGGFTISNLGAIGGTYSTPIINVPEVAILLVGRSRKLPVVVDDQIAIRLMMPLSLSYDHRLVDGGAAARFLNAVIGYLKSPTRLLMAP